MLRSKTDRRRISESGCTARAPPGSRYPRPSGYCRPKESSQPTEILRIEAGRPRFGTDMDSTNLPDEVGLPRAISTTKGCYVGQEVVARLRTYGRVNRRFVRFRFPEGRIDPGTPLRRPEEETPGKIEAGRVTSSAVSPESGPIGLGYAFREILDGDRLVSTVASGDIAIVSDLASV
ncbi:MAG: hypothetical protein DMF55_12615 [Acidobacteria bacterium]|nr:MAG: hypothetical protein DMF55_12615 [Acidobacteriota bacterium]